MRNARTLLAEQRLWKAVWQQVETFLDQIDGAADKDDAPRRRMDGLLRAARAVEHVRARDAPATALGDPVITALPSHEFLPKDGRSDTVSGTLAWDVARRRWRLPGADEVELAVGLLATKDGKIPDEHPVHLPPPVTVFQVVGDDGVRRSLRLPSYPGPATGGIVDAGPPLRPSVKDDGERASLFGFDARTAAALGTSDADPLRAWRTLSRARRGANRKKDGDDVRLATSLAGPPWGADSASTQTRMEQLAASVAALPPGAAVPAATLAALRAAAGAASAALRPDADDLAAAAQVLDDTGGTAAVADLVRQAADATRSRLTGLGSVDAAAAALQAAPASAPQRAALAAAIAAIRAAAVPAGLVDRAVDDETSPLGVELDTVVATRVAYPDGTLRSLRTLETGFVAAWPGYRRWLIQRHRLVLDPAMTAFQGPFVAGLRALLRGGFTGLAAEGLALGPAGATVGADQVDLDAPSSVVPTLGKALEPGQLGIVAGERPAVVVVLGVEARLTRASLHVSPLRLSTAPPSAAPGPAGTLPPGTPITRSAPRGLTERELRRGRSDDGSGADALVRETLGLYGRLRLLFGTDAVERWLQSLPATAAVTSRLVPDPPAPPAVAGSVPGNATTVVLHGLPATFWSAPGQDGVPSDTALPEPRVARPGELLLLRGRVAGEGDAPGPLVQAPVDVDDVYAIPGSALARLDTTRAGVLSTSAAALPAGDKPAPLPLVCGPDEPLTVILLRRSWARQALVSDLSLRRDFAGFDVPSLAARTLLPLDLVQAILRGPPPDMPGVGRAQELAAALDVLDEWTRHAE